MFARRMKHAENDHAIGFDSIEDFVRKPVSHYPSKVTVIDRPALGRFFQLLEHVGDREQEFRRPIPRASSRTIRAPH